MMDRPRRVEECKTRVNLELLCPAKLTRDVAHVLCTWFALASFRRYLFRESHADEK